jgi:nucleoside phosphorylase
LITDSYRNEKESLFSPEAFLGERKYICDTAIATFSGEIFNSVLEKYPHKEVARVTTVNGSKPVYLLDINGKNAVFYLSAIGSALAGNDIIEISWQTGIKNLIIFGSAGSLDNEATDGRYVIPTQAYRDEGMSYHYAPPSDFIDVKNSGKLA